MQGSSYPGSLATASAPAANNYWTQQQQSQASLPNFRSGNFASRNGAAFPSSGGQMSPTQQNSGIGNVRWNAPGTGFGSPQQQQRQGGGGRYAPVQQQQQQLQQQRPQQQRQGSMPFFSFRSSRSSSTKDLSGHHEAEEHFDKEKQGNMNLVLRFEYPNKTVNSRGGAGDSGDRMFLQESGKQRQSGEAASVQNGGSGNGQNSVTIIKIPFGSLLETNSDSWIAPDYNDNNAHNESTHNEAISSKQAIPTAAAASSLHLDVGSSRALLEKDSCKKCVYV